MISINRTPGDFVKDTRHLSVEDRGAYQEILDQIVILGQDADPPALPDDDRAVANMLGWSVAKWRKTKARLCEGPLAVLIASGGRISQVRIAIEIEEARKRILAGHIGGTASGAARRAKREMRDRITNGRSTDVPTDNERSLNGSANGDPNGSRTSHESRVTSHEGSKKERSEIEASPLVLPESGVDALDLIRSVVEAVAPDVSGVDDIQISLWLRDINPDPLWIAAIIVDCRGTISKAHNAGLISTILRNRQKEGWIFRDDEGEPADPEPFIKYILSPARRQRGAA